MAIPIPRFTIDMLDELPDDGNRYELLDGMLLVTPAPNFAHQVVASRLIATLTQALAPGNRAHVVGIGAIQKGKYTQLQPDVLVVPATYAPGIHWREMREWWLAVEVLSPSSRLYDREVKRAAYLAFGVEQYWLADPERCLVEVFTPQERDGEPRVASDVIVWRPAALDTEIAINLADLFRDVCEPFAA